ncbi:hypothetical protein QYM36_006373 [Artemia franciscana]|uniref:Integrase catalytic domain-containing protein n=1 Tax=Artemia franciscana TaxID=6661 RepID=A0AA88I922_ARTSF|nr:hypothetical protein QYM36_006373 [Artemia franciscana]
MTDTDFPLPSLGWILGSNIATCSERQTTRSGALSQLQAYDPTLSFVGEKALRKFNGLFPQQFLFQDGIYYQLLNVRLSRRNKQTIVPSEHRSLIIKIGHDNVMSGHLSKAWTTDYTPLRFWQRRIYKDTGSCMKVIHSLSNDRQVQTKGKGYRKLLAITYYASKYPEAIPLRSTNSPVIIDDIAKFVWRYGIPDIIFTDQGTQFLSSVLKKLYQVLNIKPIRTSLYHLEMDGRTEGFDGTLISIPYKCVGTLSNDWYQLMPFLLFAYRETTHPHIEKQLYGQNIRGVLDLMHEEYKDKTKEDPIIIHRCDRCAYDYPKYTILPQK